MMLRIASFPLQIALAILWVAIACGALGDLPREFACLNAVHPILLILHHIWY